MSAEERVHLEQVDSEALKQSLTSVVDSSISMVGTSMSALSGEYKHLDELMKLMVLKLKDIHQQIVKEGNEWFDKRSETLDSLNPFFTDIETLHDNSEALLKMMNKID
ncbi:hypothetical protein WA556_000578, partial [Blastocystis sp. ATCC 50177/Nand II]